MSIKTIIKNAILRCDLLRSNANLRYQGEPAYESIFGGVISIIIAGFFFIIFIVSIQQLISLQNIISQKVLSHDESSDSKITDFYFMIGIQNLDISEINSLFSLNIKKLKLNKNYSIQNPYQEIVPLQQCDISYLNSLDVNGLDYVLKLNYISGYLCPSKNKITISGSPLISIAQLLLIQIKYCQNSTLNNFSCLDPVQRDSLLDNLTLSKGYISLNLLFINTLITPSDQKSISKTVKANQFITFSKTYSAKATLQIVPYHIQTDTNFFPWSHYQYQTGYYINNLQSSYIPNVNGTFFTLYVFKSLTKLTVTRQYGKIDDVLSYIGGLFALIFVFFQLVIGPYNEYKYELSIAQATFKNQLFDQINEETFNFWTYLKYVTFDWLNEIGLAPSQMSTMKKLHKIRQQACFLLDTRFLMKRLNYLQKQSFIFLKKQESICLQLSEMPSMHQMRKRRKIQCFSEQQLLSNKKYIKQCNNGVHNLTEIDFNQSNNIISSQNNVSKQNQFKIGISQKTQEMNSSDQQNEQIKKQISEAFFHLMKKDQNIQNGQNFKKIFNLMNNTFKKALSVQKKPSEQLQQELSQKNDILQNFSQICLVTSTLKNKLCQICQKNNANFMLKCNHLFHPRCLEIQMKRLNKNVKNNNCQITIKQPQIYCPLCMSQQQKSFKLFCIKCYKQCDQNTIQKQVKILSHQQKSDSSNVKRLNFKKLQSYQCRKCYQNFYL